MQETVSKVNKEAKIEKSKTVTKADRVVYMSGSSSLAVGTQSTVCNYDSLAV